MKSMDKCLFKGPSSPFKAPPSHHIYTLVLKFSYTLLQDRKTNERVGGRMPTPSWKGIVASRAGGPHNRATTQEEGRSCRPAVHSSICTLSNTLLTPCA
jgi:hypothetical protein